MEVIGHLHVPVPLFQEKKIPVTHLISVMRGTQSRSGGFGKNYESLALVRIQTPDHRPRSIFASPVYWPWLCDVHLAHIHELEPQWSAIRCQKAEMCCRAHLLVCRCEMPQEFEQCTAEAQLSVSEARIRRFYKCLEGLCRPNPLEHRRVNKQYLESSATWCWSRMEKISWTDHVRNEVLQTVKGDWSILQTIKRRKANWIGHILT